MIWQSTFRKTYCSKINWTHPRYVGHGDGKAGDGMLVNDLEDSPIVFYY